MSKYKISSLEKTNPPEGGTGASWYQYIIENDINTIISFRSGSENEVRKVALDSVNRLNEKYLTRLSVKNFSKPAHENSFSAYL